jgi:hypothetical protein
MGDLSSWVGRWRAASSPTSPPRAASQGTAVSLAAGSVPERLLQGAAVLIAGLLPACTCAKSTSVTQSGDVGPKDDSTEVSCGCTVTFAPGDHGCTSLLPKTQAFGPFDVCLPPGLNLGQDAGAGALSDSDWAAQVDGFCQSQMPVFMQDLEYLLSKHNCENHCIVSVSCVHTQIGSSAHATGPNPACAKPCNVTECNYGDCNPDNVQPNCGRDGQFDIGACQCTQIDSNSASWMSECGVTPQVPSPSICIRPPGDQDPATSSFSMPAWVSSLPNEVTLDHTQSTADVTVHFIDGVGAPHSDEKTFNVAGNVVLHGACMPGADCDVLLEMNLVPDDVKFHFSTVFCGALPPCVQDVDVTASTTAITGGTGVVPVHIDATGAGLIPMGALQLRAETVVSGVPNQKPQREIFNGSNNQNIPFEADFGNRTFSIPSAPFTLADGSGALNLVGTIVNQPPMAEAGPAQVVECTSPTGGQATLSGSAIDPDNNLMDVGWWQGHVLGPAVGSDRVVTITAPFAPPKLTTQYSFSATDTFLTLGIDQTFVTVQDTTPPALSLAATPSCVWAPNHGMILYQLGDGLDAKATDPCDPSPKVFISDVTSNQPVSGGGSGNTAPDIIFGKDAFCVRSERDGTVPASRQYTVTVEAVDASGNTATKQTVIRVQHDQGGGACALVDSSRVVSDGDPRCSL